MLLKTCANSYQKDSYNTALNYRRTLIGILFVLPTTTNRHNFPSNRRYSRHGWMVIWHHRDIINKTLRIIRCDVETSIATTSYANTLKTLPLLSLASLLITRKYKAPLVRTERTREIERNENGEGDNRKSEGLIRVFILPAVQLPSWSQTIHIAKGNIRGEKVGENYVSKDQTKSLYNQEACKLSLGKKKGKFSQSSNRFYFSEMNLNNEIKTVICVGRN